jgi:hypothetical protein
LIGAENGQSTHADTLPVKAAGVTTGTSSSGKFASSNGMDFNLEGLGINAFTLAGTYTAKSQLGGTLTYTGGTTNTFTSSYDTDYDLTPSLATIVGYLFR